MYTQNFTPITGSLGLSALSAVIPLFVLFVLLGLLKVSARWAALSALIAAIGIAFWVYEMPAVQIASGTLEGAATGFFPIIWIGINAIWLFRLTQLSGHDKVIRGALARLSPDLRVQTLLIAFCFGALLESLAGGGAPVAICAVMLIALGIKPVQAAAICLIADTSPVAFGSLGLPISVLSKVTGLPVHELGVMVGRQTPILALFIPLILIVIADGRRGLKEIWPLALVAGISFATGQAVGSMYLPIELVDISAALLCIGAVVTFLKVWSPERVRETESSAVLGPAIFVPAKNERFEMLQSASTLNSGGGAGIIQGTSSGSRRYSARTLVVARETIELFRAFAPYAIVIALVALSQIKVLKELLELGTSTLHWPLLDVVTPEGRPLGVVNAKFEWLLSAGSIVLFAGCLTIPVLGLSAKQALKVYLKNLGELKWAIFTVCSVVGVAYVMNLSGQIVTLGIWAAQTGPAFAFISPILGWIATSLTGSDTSANALFGVLQITTAHHTGLSDVLLAAANSSGGVVGKAISPQNLTIAAVAVGISGKEGVLFRKVIGWTLLMITIMSVLVLFQSTPVLSWMVPSVHS
ncbi:L-lactate permease [Pseudomonas sp. MWU13-2105]|uniref:L-lactate permease n=1 Tax=Pseudomonas sp. MWU13-2105 TaxID=2935074 RepID=UPI00200C8706|nr:L-lactate permease [Pseudomonas sp. MWU13-2105]